MEFKEDIKILTQDVNNHLDLDSRSIKDLIDVLAVNGCSFNEDKSLIVYNSGYIPADTLKIPIKLWTKINSEKDVRPSRTEFIGTSDSLRKPHSLELSLWNFASLDVGDDDRMMYGIKGNASLITNLHEDYTKGALLLTSLVNTISLFYTGRYYYTDGD